MKKINLKKINIAMIFFTLLYMIIVANRHKFWIDELDWTIGIIDGKNLKEIIHELLLYGYNLPLYYVILFFFYNIAPTQKLVLMLPSIVFSIIGIIYIYKSSKLLLDEKNGTLSILITLGSLFLFTQIAWQVRPYGLLFCLSSWSLYNYIVKLYNYNLKNNILYYISITLLLFTHWYSGLVVLCYGIIDFILLIKKKVKFKYFIMYIVPFILILLWIILLINNHITDLSQYWPETPNIYSIFLLIVNSLSINIVILVLLCSITLFRISVNKIKIKLTQEDKICIVCLFFIIMIISGVYIYSKFINISSSLWVNRYFISILPHIILCTSYIISKCIKFMNKTANDNISKVITYVCNYTIIAFLIIIVIINLVTSYKNPNATDTASYEDIVEYLCEQEDIYNDDTLVICSYGKYWIEYYFNKKDIQYPANIITIDPKIYGNKYDDYKIKLNEFSYNIKNSEQTEEIENIDINNILKYKKIYFIVLYRHMNKDIAEELLEKYDIVENEELEVFELTQKDRE
jgi:hypothetical protein